MILSALSQELLKVFSISSTFNFTMSTKNTCSLFNNTKYRDTANAAMETCHAVAFAPVLCTDGYNSCASSWNTPPQANTEL